MNLLIEPSQSVPIIHEADICVLGGSCTGLFAAVRATRPGARVVIVEKENCFGGIATTAMVNVWHSLWDTEGRRQIISGLTEEVIDRLDRRGAVKRWDKTDPSCGFSFNSEELKIELDEVARESALKIYFHTLFVAPHLDADGRLDAVIVENKSGRGAIRAKYFIDATGDGDVAARLGCPTYFANSLQPATACARFSNWSTLCGADYTKLLREHGAAFDLPQGFAWGTQVPGSEVYMMAATRVYGINPAEADDLTFGEIEGRRQVRAIQDIIRRYLPASKLSLEALPSRLGLRESRHVRAAYQLTGDDVLFGRRFDDAIARGSYRVDIHHQDKPGITLRYLDGIEVYNVPGESPISRRWREAIPDNPTFYQIPYRSMLPQGGFENLIVAGRMIDMDPVAHAAVRVMVNMNQIGEAAGVAAALALRANKGFPQVDPADLQRGLARGGSICPATPSGQHAGTPEIQAVADMGAAGCGPAEHQPAWESLLEILPPKNACERQRPDDNAFRLACGAGQGRPNDSVMSNELNSRTNWFHEARYGMFIHWGAYSAAARGEWVANRERVSKRDYIALCVDRFRAESYDPSAWAAFAKESGMGYAVLTTRHHDGFALWPTDAGDFHAGRLGPKRDLVGPFVEAFRRAGLKVGLYYSPADWFHPDYPGPHFRDWSGKDDWSSDQARLRFIAYYRAQLVELMTRYGKIDYLWYDGCIPDNLQSREVNEEMLRLQPDILINERNGKPWHVSISEQAVKAAKPEVAWEACMTLNENWGYHAGDTNWKSPRQVIQMLTDTASKAGNLLLNVGPRSDGSISAESVDILRKAGDWLKRNGESIHGSSRSPFTWSNWGRVTTKGSRIYLHIWNSTGPELSFAELKNKVRSARYLDGGKNVTFEQIDGRLVLRGLPVPLPDPIATTLVLDLEGEPEAITPQTTFWIPGEAVT